MTPSPGAVRYQETLAGCAVDLSDNTNLWGPPPSVATTIASCLAASRYPSAYSDNLKRSIAGYVGLDESMVVTGCGSDDVLDSTIRAFRKAGNVMAEMDPTFSMMKVFASVSGLEVVSIVPGPGIVADFAATEASIIYLCSPNNPTGSVLSLEIIEAIVARAKGVVIVDEAYIEFGGQSSVELLASYDNLIVTRTMSKAFGLAGFRVGYGLGNARLIASVESARGPYKVSQLSEEVSVRVLDNDLKWVAESVDEAIALRRTFSEQLTSVGYPPLDSAANFVLVPVSDAASVESRMRLRGVAVRRFDGLSGIGDAVRISIGPREMMNVCFDAFREAVS